MIQNQTDNIKHHGECEKQMTGGGGIALAWPSATARTAAPAQLAVGCWRGQRQQRPVGRRGDHGRAHAQDAEGKAL